MPRQASSSQPHQCVTELLTATTVQAAVIRGFFILLYLTFSVTACNDGVASGNWCPAVPAVADEHHEPGVFVPAVAAVCPEHATVGCGDIRHSDWCCPSGHTCGLTAANSVGCCPQGQTCGNEHEPIVVPTITTSIVAAGVPVVLNNEVEHPDPDPAVLLVPTPVIPNVPSIIETLSALVVSELQVISQAIVTPIETIIPAAIDAAGEFCSTIVADGPGLPTTIPGVCGTVLVIAEGPSLRNDLWINGWYAWIGLAAWTAVLILL